MTSPSDTIIREWVANCDPGRVLGPDDARYVAIDEGEPVRGSVGRSCVESLFRTIDLSGDDRPTTQLFTGFIGTGKSTELRRLERLFSERSRSRSTEVVFLSFDEHYIDLNSPIEVSEVLNVIAFALDAAAIVAESKADEPITELHDAPMRLAKRFRSGSYLKHLYDQVRAITPELSKIEFEAGGLKLMGELRSNPFMRGRAAQIGKVQFEQFVADARGYMQRAVERIKRAKQVDRVVVIADGIEKIRAKRDTDREAIESSVASLFVDQAEYLALPCHAIYTFPLALRYRYANVGLSYSARPSILPMVKVCLPDGSPFEPGIEKLRDLLARRVDLVQLFGTSSVREPSVLRNVIRDSGGYVRDLLRVTRDAIYSAESFPLTQALIDRVLRELVQNYQLVLRADDLALLDQVARTHLAPSEQDASVERFGRLIEQQMVLGYRNGLADTPEWYRLHPLVERTQIFRSPRSAK